MSWVSKEQLERARQIPVLDYVLSYESGNFKPVGNGYRSKEHESLAVSEKGFYWHSQGFGGKTALDYLTNIRGYGLVDAVCMLLGEEPQERSDKPKTPTPIKKITPNAKPPPEHLPFAPPLRNKDNKRVIAYLQSRGINRDLIMDCIQKGSLYESTVYHNCVFTGKNENGKTSFAALRGTTSRFMRDADGSDKRYGFVIPPDNPNSRQIAVFESPIDCLSYKTLCRNRSIPRFDGWILSLSGTSVLALEHFIKQNPEVAHCLICTDNDEAGEKIATTITEIPGINTERSPPLIGKDWNDTLEAVLKAERLQNRTRHSNNLNL